MIGKTALALAVLLTPALFAQPYQLSDFTAPRTTAEARAEFRQTEREEKIFARLAKELYDETESDWGGAFWTAGLLNELGPEVKAAVRQALEDFPNRSAGFQEVALRSANTLFPDQFEGEVRNALEQTSTPKAFAIAAYYLLNLQDTAEQRLALTQMLAEKFPDWRNDGRLAMLWKDLGAINYPDRPPLPDLLRHGFGGKAVIYSFQRRDRRHPGIAVVRKANGEFVTDDAGEILAIPQLAMSRTNMAATITFGNSPEGLYTITTSGVASNPFIGPTPYLYSKVTYEASVAEFYHDPAMGDIEWSKGLYLALLPKSWRGYFPIHEAWYAGKAGRSEMLNHGTTIDPEHYRGQPYYPQTPSAGCLCTLERWDPETGALLESDQVRLLNAWHEAGDGTGYFLLVELDDQKKPVSAEEVRQFITNLEQST